MHCVLPFRVAVRRCLFALALLSTAFLCTSVSAQTPARAVHFPMPSGYTFHPLPNLSMPISIRQWVVNTRKFIPVRYSGAGGPATTLEGLIEQANGAETPYATSYGAGVQLDQGSFPDLSVFDYNLPSLLAGSLVRGDANYIQSGQLVSLPLTPSSGTVILGGVTLKDGATNSVHVTQATQAQLAQAFTTLANQPFQTDQSTLWNCRQQDASSSADASFQVNVSLGYLTYASFKNLFSSADTSTQHHVVIQCKVELFTLYYKPDTTPSNVANAVYLDPATPVNTAAEFIGPGRPPLVVNSVTYGAEFFMMVDSTASSRDMEDALNAAFSYAGVSGSVGLDDKQKSTLSNSEIHVLSMGGRASAAGQIAPVFSGNSAPDALVAWLKGNVDVSASGTAVQETGVPISYQLSYLDTTTVAETATVNGVAKPTSNAQMTGATIQFQQEGNGKGKDTKVDIYLEDTNQREVEVCQIGPNSPLTNNSRSPIYMLNSLDLATEAAMAGGFLHMLIHPSDHDVWKFTASLVLTFSDGTTQRGQITTALSSDNSTTSAPGHEANSATGASATGKELRIALNTFMH